jgi:hypothetical protein
MDVAAWLRGLGLEQYAQLFRDNDIDGEILCGMTAEDLKELGISSFGHRRRLLNAITALGGGPPTRDVAQSATSVTSAPTSQQPEPAEETAPNVGRERREAERAIVDWEQETRRLGRALAWMTLNASEMTSEKWSHRFIMAMGPAIKGCAFLFYGAKFGALMGLPEKADYSVPMVEQLPARYLPVFTKGSMDATLQGIPIRMQGAVDREDGRKELYRTVFIPLSVKPNDQQRLAFGAFNYRVADTQA